MAVIIFEGAEKFNSERFLFLSIQQFERTRLWGDFLSIVQFGGISPLCRHTVIFGNENCMKRKYNEFLN